MRKTFCRMLLPLFLLTMVTPQLHARDKARPFIIGETVHIESKALAEKRTLNIYLPAGYKDSVKTYPVLYLLDGSANEDFLHITGLVQFMTMTFGMPETIVVGVANVDRKRDFTFPTRNAAHKKAYPTTGGSAKFISFVETELIPFVAQHYRTGKQRMIMGQSLGGLMATEILFKKPALFQTYLIVSPSLWWDAESLLDTALAPHSDSTRILLAVGSEGEAMEKDAARLAKMLQDQHSGTVDFLPLPKENHATILHQAALDMFRLLYPMPE